MDEPMMQLTIDGQTQPKTLFESLRVCIAFAPVATPAPSARRRTLLPWKTTQGGHQIDASDERCCVTSAGFAPVGRFRCPGS